MKRTLKAIGIARIIGLCVLLNLLVIRVVDPGLVQIARHQSFDTFQRVLPREVSPQPVIIVDIDEKSLREVGQWPWPRTKIAHLIQNVAASGAAAIAFDLVFAEADRLSPNQIAQDNPDLPPIVTQALIELPENDDVLANMMGQFRVILGQTAVRSVRDNSDEKANIPSAEVAFLGDDPKPYLLKFQDLVQNRPEFEEVASGRGVFTIQPGLDGIIRRVPLVVMVQDKIRLALSTELLRVATGGNAFAISTNDAGVSDIRLAGQAINTDNNARVWPYFSPSVPSRYVSARDVLNLTAPMPELRGKMVMVGTSAVGLEDFRATPLGVQMPGVEIHAQVLENILSQTLLVRPNYAIAVELLVIAVLGLLIIAILPAVGAWLAVAGTAVLLAAYLWFSWYAFAEHRLLIDPTFPSLNALIIFIVMVLANYFREEKRRAEVHQAMGQYVSPALVDQLAKNPDRLTLGGETKELSILFSDIRGFTGLSESYKSDPQGLTQLMNTFLTEMSDAILNNRGTIDKFMGDAVMAFWNAPLDENDHPNACCRAALEMVDRVNTLNRDRRAIAEQENALDNFKPINIGIGINTGTCVVGNMGSESRFDYTAIGDSVNLASRLEGQSKPYGIQVVVGEATACAVSNTFALLEIDLIRVKGKQDAEHIFGLFGDASLADSVGFQSALSANKAMIDAYRAQNWKAAMSALSKLASIGDEHGLHVHDYLSIYRGRIEAYQKNPPPKNWDGVFEAQTK
ncbi:MAG: adenylate/guanylate cyclase domain-containing protein [Pseudomonadota bacterium]